MDTNTKNNTQPEGMPVDLDTLRGGTRYDSAQIRPAILSPTEEARNKRAVAEQFGGATFR